MNERQLNHLERLKKRFAVKFHTKFSKGTVEHPGDLQDVGLYKLLEFAEEEVLDQWSYIGTTREQLFALEDLILKMDDSSERTLLLQQLWGKSSDPSSPTTPEGSPDPHTASPHIQPLDNQGTALVDDKEHTS